ncbi:fumarylacetoacetate hydrolase family protein [Novosphingobium flavum]|uniref:fumarylacetoacetate hydrolase family protein n=1 Tax=Novosphingobium aerophilum TaxID=2839843 RepID=UPI0016395176|nr:fumarylacetoacetate hydrolase family protein [Novosphingobium aerophilum]MBC2662773.1 fumarylacetoacetate hydrolase family protein [Novosphingobium aerophilum]
MKLITIDDVPGGSPGAMLDNGEMLHLRRSAREGTIEAWLPGSVAAILAAGPEGVEAAAGIAKRAEALDEDGRARLRSNGALLPATMRLLPPIPRPGLIVAAGLAYRSHLEEMSGTPAPPHPTGFMKSPTSLSATGQTLLLPRGATERVDFEGELAIIFGRHCHDIAEDEAFDYVAGYAVANDFSARDWVEAVWQATAPWEARLTWEVNIMGKQMPGFTALGPCIVTKDDIPDPTALRLTTEINGKVMQDALVSDLIFPLARSIAHFSRWYSFAPGDVLLTGTPAGVGVGRKPQVFMRDGDEIEVRIDRIGALRNRFAAG